MNDSSPDLYIEQLNEVYIRVYSHDAGIEQELSEYFTFMVPGARFTPAYKSKMWDGKIKLYALSRKTIYAGLLKHVIEFAEYNKYKIDLSKVDKSWLTTDVSQDEIRRFVDSLNPSARGKLLDIRDYQYKAIHHMIFSNRSLSIVPTSGGKSLLIYSTIRWHLKHNRKIIIIVPTTNLVEQLYSDFEDYSSFNGFPVNDYCQKLYSGQSKEFTRHVLITTYQSIMRWTPQEFRNHNIDVAIIDEAHLAKAKMITKIMESLTTTKYRIGLTGTLDGTLTNSLVIEGLTGPIHKVISTKELMDDGHVTELKIKCILLQYSNETKKAASRLKYQDELNYLVTNPKRNQVITSMALSCSGNTLILFQFVEKHGKVLYEMIKEKAKNRNVYFIYGNTSAAEREEIRKKIESEVDSIIIGSYQTVSTGINIPSLENIIFASPSKSRVRNLQSIGRGLRLKEGKNHCILFDIADDLSWKKRINYTLTHYLERVRIYTDEQFKFKIHKIVLED